VGDLASVTFEVLVPLPVVYGLIALGAFALLAFAVRRRK
jgi:hypothetical protein